MTRDIPHLRIVLTACAAAIVGYAGFCIWVVSVMRDATMIGDIVGTWKSFAVAAFAFWLGSSSGGKTAPLPDAGSTTTTTTTTVDPPPPDPDAPPQPVTVVNQPHEPVPVQEERP